MSSSPTTADAGDDADLATMGKHQKPNFEHQASKRSFNLAHEVGWGAWWFVGIWYLVFGFSQ
ncbi:MAG: hypothetical protein DME21_12735 [Verrucomicrobia bacterium]|nr:MAG: hypothetical protein DME21_12735 [Verrucomicrobiota bacterium]